ncbi:hypothetical protein QBC46DRAFT_415742 [Diplogelasinospora grovesii]|uniref:Uncharacterized protein n=1 Tax=Diplogelasinospora grovesii TaxID=303347 RepID=A0AAN6S891_9PEZI|nr:hypothetical protein QBC46DRAFT_415742 [Diplogelasinospora grovesii]
MSASGSESPTAKTKLGTPMLGSAGASSAKLQENDAEEAIRAVGRLASSTMSWKKEASSQTWKFPSDRISHLDIRRTGSQARRRLCVVYQTRHSRPQLHQTKALTSSQPSQNRTGVTQAYRQPSYLLPPPPSFLRTPRSTLSIEPLPCQGNACRIQAGHSQYRSDIRADSRHNGWQVTRRPSLPSPQPASQSYMGLRYRFGHVIGRMTGRGKGEPQPGATVRRLWCMLTELQVPFAFHTKTAQHRYGRPERKEAHSRIPRRLYGGNVVKSTRAPTLG